MGCNYPMRIKSLPELVSSLCMNRMITWVSLNMLLAPLLLAQMHTGYMAPGRSAPSTAVQPWPCHTQHHLLPRGLSTISHHAMHQKTSKVRSRADWAALGLVICNRQKYLDNPQKSCVQCLAGCILPADWTALQVDG